MKTPVPPLLQTTNLSIGNKTGRSTKTLAASLHLEIYPGQLICLLGPNGCGKSTLIRTLSGLQPALSGRVEIGGQPVAKMKPADVAKKLSMVLTEKINSGNLNAYAVIALGRYPYTNWIGTLSSHDKDIIEWAIQTTRTEAFAQRKIYQLSDGESQQVMLARALAQDTPLIILDEPTAHLDLPNRVSMMRQLHQLARTTSKAILISTHDLDLALQTADQLWLLRSDGKLFKGAPEDMVLNGTFEAAFHKDGFQFDKASGTFIIHREGSKNIRVTGRGTAFFWTKRALLREGYAVSTGNTDHSIEVREDGNATKWIYRNGEAAQECESIANMLDVLRKH